LTQQRRILTGCTKLVTTSAETKGKAMDGDDISRLDDFEVIAERQQVMAALTALTDKYRRLNDEIAHRETLRWMLQP
jgi:hypothetical protein